MPLDIVVVASAVIAVASICVLGLLTLRYRRRIDLLKQELALTRYPASLPRAEKRSIAKAIATHWARKALVAKGHRKRLIEHYCLETAKEICLVYNRRELLGFTVRDVKRALDLLYSHCEQARIAKINVARAVDIVLIYKDSDDVRFYYNAGRAILDAAMMNWVRFAYRVSVFVLPTERVRNAAIVYFAGYLALALYEGEPSPSPEPLLPATLETHAFSSRGICRRCGTTRAAAIALKSSCVSQEDSPSPTLRERARAVGRALRSVPGRIRIPHVFRRKPAER